MNDLIDAQLNSDDVIAEVYRDTFGEDIKKEEIREIMQDFLF
jgi:hypothetical protein